jgi:mono/diheme cytochrome c family protein
MPMCFVRGCAGLAAFAVGLVIAQNAAFAADAAKGKKLYNEKYGCFQCHGTLGQGGGAGPKLAPNPMPYEALASFVRTSSQSMPPYQEQVLPNEDLQDMYAYLLSIPPAPDPKTIPLLKD